MLRFILLSFLAFPAFAVDELPPKVDENLPEVPEPPLPVQSGETLQPDITIIRRGKKTIQEYRRGGKLYMVKVIPDVGPPYFFLDSNGDGKLDIRRSDLSQDTNVNMWKVLEWD